MNQIRSILYFSEGEGLGDGLLKIPFIKGLRQHFPEATLTWSSGFDRTLLAADLYPWIQKDINEILNHTSYGYRWWHLIHHSLHQRRFDLIIDGQSKALPTLALKRIPHQYFISASLKSWFSHQRDRRFADKPRHAIDRLKQLFYMATGHPLSLTWSPDFTPEVLTTANRLLPYGSMYVGLSPGAGGSDKCWPLENYLTLAQEIQSHGAVPVFLLGPQEALWRERLAIPGALFPLQETTSSLDLTIALGQRLSVAVCNDSGTSHLLAVSGIPLVVLFGPTSPEKICPAAETLTIIRAQTFGGHHMNAIPFGAVMQVVRNYLRQQASKQAS